MDTRNTIYHIVTMDDLRACIKGNYYRPRTFEQDGFIHCTGDESTSLLVLEDYFAEAARRDAILIMGIDSLRLESDVRYEPPAPVRGAGTSHSQDGALFPHIYGHLNIDAISGVGKVERVEGKFVWPSAFVAIENYLW